MSGVMTIGVYVHQHVAVLLNRVVHEAARAGSDASDESIHDLRVAIRRLSESLRVFEDLFPHGSARKVRREIKAAMHLAGEVRNHDIATDLMHKAALTPGAEMDAGRGKAAERLAAVLDEWNEGDAPRAWRERLFGGAASRVKKKAALSQTWRPDESVEGNAKRVLPAMAQEYFAAGRQMVLEERHPADLHPFRLDTKRLRYTLEMFRDVYGPSLADKLELLKPVQQTLGEVNDCVATAAAFHAGRIFRGYLEHRAESKARAFAHAWTTGFDRKGQEELWLTYLADVPVAPLREVESAVHGEHLAGDKVRSA